MEPEPKAGASPSNFGWLEPEPMAGAGSKQIQIVELEPQLENLGSCSAPL